MVVLNGEVDTDQVLIGWKAIAAALGVSVATAQGWEDTLKLPVYRLGGQVRAAESGLRAWEKQFYAKKRKNT